MQNKKLIFPILVAALISSSCGNKKVAEEPISNSSSFSSENVSSPNSNSISEVSSNESHNEEEVYDTHVYGNYYDSVLEWSSKEDLLEKLKSAISNGKNSLKYASPTNWESNSYADQALDDFESLDVVYSNKNELKIKNAGYIAMGWSREHAFCASLLTGSVTSNAVKQVGRATDFHNLFASNYSGNSSRGNKNFGEVSSEDTEYTDNSSVNNGKDGYRYNEKEFEPGDYDKGRLARSIFYMAVMYNEDELDDKNNVNMKGVTLSNDYVEYVAGDDCAFAHGNLQDLLKWNNFPVDRLEYQHNESVYSHVYSDQSLAQNNRNPFVDYPELVDYIFGDKQNQSGKLENLKPSFIALDIDSNEINNYAIVTAKREYQVGEIFSKDDYTLTAVNKDFTTCNIDFVDDTPSYTFTKNDVGTKTLQIQTPINTISYEVVVKAKTGIDSCSYFHKLVKENVPTSFTSGSSTNLNGVSWTLSWENSATKITSYQNNKGVQIGSSTNSPKEVIIKTSNFTYNDMNSFDAIYFSGNVNSGTTADYQIIVNEEIVSTGQVQYNATESDIYGVNLTKTYTNSDIIIRVYNITKAFYWYKIGINAI